MSFYPSEKSKGLDSLNDANITSPVNGDTLVFDGEKWENSHDELSAIENVYGSKNLFRHSKSTTVVGETTFTVNASDSNIITVTNTTTTPSERVIWLTGIDDNLILPSGSYILTGCPEQTGTPNYHIGVQAYRNGSNVNLGNDTGNGLAITLQEGDILKIGLSIHSGYQIQGSVVFKVMIRDSRIKDRTYAPYAMTNRELTENKAENSVIGTVENEATASKAYGVGARFVRKGKDCVVIAAIAQGATLIQDTNYVIHDVNSMEHIARGQFNGDCDTLAPGVIYVGNAATHAPFNWAIVHTFYSSLSGVNRVQIAFCAISSSVSFRWYGSGVWSDWKAFTLT